MNCNSSMLKSLLALCAIWLVSSFAAARPHPIQEDPEDAIWEELDVVKEEFLEARERCDRLLDEALEELIDKIPSRLDLRDRLEAKEKLERDVKSFRDNWGFRVENRDLRKACQAYAEQMGAAVERCYKSYEQSAERMANLVGLDAAGEVLEARKELLGALDPDLMRRRKQLLEWLPVGTEMQCNRTRFMDGEKDDDDNGPGVVISNDGTVVVFEVPGLTDKLPRIWRFKYEEDETLTLVEQVKKDPKQAGGECVRATGTLRLSKNGFDGEYSWDLKRRNGPPTKVTGRLEWRVKRRPR